MSRSPHLLVLTWQAKYVFEGLREYAETLERLLAAETARVLTREMLPDILAKSREPLLEPEDPSEELVELRDSFPTILRGSLLPYIHGNFERITQSIANLYLSDEPIPKGKNTNEITKRVNAAWPGTFSEEATLQLCNYMHLRHACAHTAGKLGSDLFDPKQVAKAAQHTVGAVFRPLAALETDLSTLTKTQRWSGYVEFDASFLPAAIAFHASQIERIANSVVAPSRGVAGAVVRVSETKLSSSTTIHCYYELVKAGDKAKLGCFIIERFDERYFLPVEHSDNKHGFTVMAIACLIIETLESFYQGIADTKGASKKMFREFFSRDENLSDFKDGDWFFNDIRCGILHQAETRGGWRILRRGPLLDEGNKAINATVFLRQLRKSVKRYASELQNKDDIWINFCKKMDAICLNCQRGN